MNNKLYRIGQLSKKAELPISTLNHYLHLKLIKPEKVTSSGYRLFSNKTLETILEIQKLKKEYLPLSVIKQQLRKDRELLIKEPSAQYRQLTLPTFEPEYPPITFQFPSTRFQGSKLKLVEWIWQNCKHLDFNSVLDAFGGTACVSYLFKTRGKQVFYNDYLKSNYYIGLALIENSGETLTQEDVEEILKRHPEMKYPTFIQETFKGIYFTDEENEWLDVVVTNIDTLITNIYKKAIAYFALFQSCVIKRPYNLFHRKNL
ncbi:MAG TPA: MerR family transcriptional regulator, partial [Thermoplasmata archaeon]|nr:MerR family transcriptional regulator [Thermoplasmata archaeon]